MQYTQISIQFNSTPLNIAQMKNTWNDKSVGTMIITVRRKIKSDLSMSPPELRQEAYGKSPQGAGKNHYRILPQ